MGTLALSKLGRAQPQLVKFFVSFDNFFLVFDNLFLVFDNICLVIVNIYLVFANPSQMSQMC